MIDSIVQPLVSSDNLFTNEDDVTLSELIGTYIAYSNTSLRQLAQKTRIRRSILQKIMLDKKTATPEETHVILNVIQKHAAATDFEAVC